MIMLKDSVCLRPECVLLAASIIDGLDMTKDPCEEFYEFSSKFEF